MSDNAINDCVRTPSTTNAATPVFIHRPIQFVCCGLRRGLLVRIYLSILFVLGTVADRGEQWVILIVILHAPVQVLRVRHRKHVVL